MLLRKSDSLLYVTRTGLDFFSKDFQAGLKLTVPDNIIKDLEIISKDKLREQIELFLVEHQIPSSAAAIVLSDDVLFTKSVSLDVNQQEKEVIDFLEEVPFDHADLVYELKTDPKNASVVATNSDLFLTIKNIFEAKGWNIEIVVPDVGEIPDKQNWSQVLTKALGSKQYNFLTNKKNICDFSNSIPTCTHYSRFLVVGIIFSLLAVVILALVVYLKLK